MVMKLMMIDFQPTRTNPSLQSIIIYQYKKRNVNGVAYTIGGQQASEEMQRKFMG